jgi:hypothetical protein
MHARPRYWAPLAAALLAAALASPPPAPAAPQGKPCRVTLKDGTVLVGTARREGEYEVDAESKTLIFMPKGFFFVDDVPRRIYFAPTQMSQLDDLKPEELRNEKTLSRGYEIYTDEKPIPPLLDAALKPGDEWNDKWDRGPFVYHVANGHDVKIRQHIELVTPYFVRAWAKDTYKWPACYLTTELGPETVFGLVKSYRDFKKDEKKKDGKTDTPDDVAGRYFEGVELLRQAGWFDEAEKLLDDLLIEVPGGVKIKDGDATPTVDDAVAARRAVIKGTRCREWFNDIKKVNNAGQFARVRKWMADFPLKDADAQLQIDVREFKSNFEEADKKVDAAKRFLRELPKAPGARSELLAQAAAAVADDAQVGDADRLDVFVSQAKQAERQRAGGAPKSGQPPALGPDQLLALAVTGWLMGKGAEEPNPATAERLWTGREFVLKYLRAGRGDRAGLLSDFNKLGAAAPTLDDLTQIIPRLPPVDPATADDVKSLCESAGKVSLGGGAGRRAAPSYWLRLPREYRHSGSYPVLIVLHDAGQKPEDALDRWRAAEDDGFILAAPEWDAGKNGAYGYSDDEHAVVLRTLADLRRKFAVDSDRVFLFGLGQGGEGAFDIGLSHPDVFAGVLPMSAEPKKFAPRYYRNGQYLPFYVVDGDRSGEINKQLRELFTDWVSHGYPMLWVQYKGRGAEWYGGEVPLMLDWMRNKRRAFPLQQLGAAGGTDANHDEFTTHRTTDDRFYWMTADAIRGGCINSPDGFTKSKRPATLAARIDPAENKLQIWMEGIDKVSVWLGRNEAGSMIDFDKPLKVHLNSQGVVFNDKVAPSLTTLLDDLAERGDRRRLFLAKLELKAK